jgi:tRNA(Ile)-lysidine synthase
LLLLAAQVRPGGIEAATVDHALRDGSAAEAEMVANVCHEIGVPHATLTACWDKKPATAIQKRARAERYRRLAAWAAERGLRAIATAHHLDDQVETLIMRLNRGAGVTGLAAMRSTSPLPGGKADIPLLRPLLGWRRSELAQVCEESGVSPVADPSNSDPRFERVRVRDALASADWLDLQALAQGARNLAAADEALKWATDREWNSQVELSDTVAVYTPLGPSEIRRRIVRRAVVCFAGEAEGQPFRGRELDQLLGVLSEGGTATLRGVLCAGGQQWRFSRAPRRRGTR